MRLLLTLAFLAVPLVAQPALAQTGNQSPGQPAAGQSTSQDDPQVLPQKLQATLQQAGFTDIKVVPSSFLVQAKDRDGNPVMMVINPDSVFAVTAGPASSTTGSGASDDPRSK